MINHKSITKALQDLGAKEWSLTGDDIADIMWHTEDKKTEAEIRAAIDNPLPDTKQVDKAALLNKLGITEDEARLLFS